MNAEGGEWLGRTAIVLILAFRLASHRRQLFFTLCQLVEVLWSVRRGGRLAAEQSEVAGRHLGRVTPRRGGHERRLRVAIDEQVRHLQDIG